MGLPAHLLEAIIVRLPGIDAGRLMSVCRGLAGAVRALPELSIRMMLRKPLGANNMFLGKSVCPR